MTITVNIVTVAQSISNIGIAGINVRDIDNIPENAMPILPVLFPVPNGFITDTNFERVTFGGSSAKMDLVYTLHYRYLHAVVGSGGGLLAVYEGLLTNLAKILEKIFYNHAPTGAVDMVLSSVSDIGVLTDPGGQTMYHGVDFALRITEFVQ
jgi:hypothetical protein